MTKGFSLIEIVLIIALVAITFVGVMSLTSRIMQMEHVVKNDFIAQGLLRDGAEIVEAIKYENVSSTLPYYTNLTPNSSPTAGDVKTFALDYLAVPTANRSRIVDVTDYRDTRAKLKLDASDYYQNQTGAETPFSRVITTTYGVDGTKSYLEVRVLVYWESYGKGHQSTVTNRLYEP